MTAPPAKPGPGDQQPGETAAAFRALRIYLELGASRTCAQVGRRLGHRSERQSQVWSARWDWQRRARLWDAEAVRAADREHVEAVGKAAKRQAQEARLHAQASALVAGELVRRVAADRATLEALSIEALVRLEASMARAHNRAVLTERLALGMTTAQDGEPLPRAEAEAMAAKLTPEELDARLTGLDELSQHRRRKSRGSSPDASPRAAGDTSAPGAGDA